MSIETMQSDVASSTNDNEDSDKPLEEYRILKPVKRSTGKYSKKAKTVASASSTSGDIMRKCMKCKGHNIFNTLKVITIHL